MTIIEKNFLNQTKLKGCPVDGCPQHSKEMTYEAMISHLQKECKAIQIPCHLLGCGKIITRGKASIHFNTECTQSKLCTYCNARMSVKKYNDDHLCLGKRWKEYSEMKIQTA